MEGCLYVDLMGRCLLGGFFLGVGLDLWMFLLFYVNGRSEVKARGEVWCCARWRDRKGGGIAVDDETSRRWKISLSLVGVID